MPGFFAGFDHRNAQKALDFQALWQAAGCRAKQERQLWGQFLNVESPFMVGARQPRWKPQWQGPKGLAFAKTSR